MTRFLNRSLLIILLLAGSVCVVQAQSLGLRPHLELKHRLQLGWPHGNFACASNNIACDPAAVTLFTAMTTPPTPARRVLINSAVVSLKSAGIWSTLDVMYVLAAATQQASTLNWVNPSTFTLVPTNTPLFFNDQGWNGNGSTTYLDTTYNPTSNKINLSLNSTAEFVWSLSNNRGDGTAVMGSVNASASLYFNPWNGSINFLSVGVNDAGNNTVIPQNALGMFIADRTANNAVTVAQNGVDLATTSQASGAIPNASLRILGTNSTTNQFTQRLIAMAGFGGALNTTQRGQLYSIMAAYMNGVMVTINNYQPAQQVVLGNAQVTHHTDTGDAVDAHAGSLLYSGGKFYLYGEKHGCGFHPGAVGAWCGINVYSNATLQSDHWHYEGLVFDPSTFQTTCATTAGTFVGCYSPKMLFNVANNNFVLWVYGETATPATSANMLVFTCTTPTGGATPTTPGTGCTQQANASFVGTGVSGPEAPALMVDGSGNGWLAVTDLGNTLLISICALNAAYTQPTGTCTTTGKNGEGLFLFQRTSPIVQTYVGWGASGCGYCTIASMSFASSATPQGTYGSATVLHATGCQGQTRDAETLTINGDVTSLLMTDQWFGPGTGSGSRSNQGFANIYFQPALFVASGAMVPFTCANTTTVPGLAEVAATKSPVSNPDQDDFSDVFQDTCDITATNWRMQTVIPTRSTLTNFYAPLGINNAGCSAGNTPCPTTDGSLTADLVTLDGSKNPVAVLATVTIAASTMSWATKWTALNFNQAVTPGTEYGVRFKGSNTTGCYGLALNTTGTPAKPYTPGVERISANSGGAWTTEAGSIMFSTN